MMSKDKNLKAFVFDFGATLDTGGIHWYNVFFDQYTKEFPFITSHTKSGHEKALPTFLFIN